MLIKKHSDFSGVLNEMDIPLTEEEYRQGEYRRARGARIQDVYPQLDADQREFLMTGCTPEEWARIFG